MKEALALSASTDFVTLAKAGVHGPALRFNLTGLRKFKTQAMDSRFRGNDEG